MKWTLSFLFCFAGYALFSQTDYWAYQVYFSGCPVNHIPNGITIPDHDQKSREIINSIISGNSYDQLLKKCPDSLDQKLEKLISGKVIERNKNDFKLLFPVLVDDKRAELRKIIHNRLSGSDFSIDTIIHALNQALPESPELIFHFLWSRIIDDCWWNLYNVTFNSDKGPPGIAFIVYPPHPFQCGTNSDYSSKNDMFAMSWSYNLFDESFRVPPANSFFNLAAKEIVPKTDQEFFLKHGLIDSENNSTLFTYHENDPLDVLCDSLKGIYINKVRGLFNFSELGKIFQIPADEFFIVISHEIAYEILSELNDHKKIFIPITTRDNPDLNLKYLVSIRLSGGL